VGRGSACFGSLKHLEAVLGEKCTHANPHAPDCLSDQIALSSYRFSDDVPVKAACKQPFETSAPTGMHVLLVGTACVSGRSSILAFRATRLRRGF
jgi:hypothetical protein